MILYSNDYLTKCLVENGVKMAKKTFLTLGIFWSLLEKIHPHLAHSTRFSVMPIDNKYSSKLQGLLHLIVPNGMSTA